jgi:hypothetical protein
MKDWSGSRGVSGGRAEAAGFASVRTEGISDVRVRALKQDYREGSV